MLYHKLLKIKHFIWSKMIQHYTLNKMSRLGEEGNHIVQAFLKTLKLQNTANENQTFEVLQQFRQDLSVNNRSISFVEIGSDSEMTVAEVAQRAASPEIWAQFFYHLSKAEPTENILEIGTNLGVSGQYFIKALEGKKNGKFITLEGVKGLCEIAENQFESLADPSSFEVLHGLYDQTLINIVNRGILFNLVFIDGNHQYNATLRYFEMLKNNLADKVVVIFDDIHWSKGMRKAWREICKQKGVILSVNFFKLGVIVFDSKSTQLTSDHYQLFLSL